MPHSAPDKLLPLSHATWLLGSATRPGPTVDGLKRAAARAGVLYRPPNGQRGLAVPLAWVEEVKPLFVATGWLVPRQVPPLKSEIAAA
jgi:hypothetical protein